MVTKRKTEMEKTRAAFGRAFSQLFRRLPATLRRNWLNILMPWRLLPQPVALALIGLVALAMVCAPPTDAGRDASTIGGTLVPDGLHCAEDEVIGFVGIPDTLVCVHTDKLQELFPDPDVVRRNADCRAGVLEVRRVLQWIVDDANAAFNYDPTEGAFARSDVREMASARLADLAPCIDGNASPVKGSATECVTVERTYQDGTSEVNAYGICNGGTPSMSTATPTATPPGQR